MKNLTNSAIDRQNILSNLNAVEDIQKHVGLVGMLLDGEYKFTKKQIVDFYVVDDSTIERYISLNELELKSNGYEIFKGVKLKKFKEEFGWMLGEVNKIPQLGVFNFRAFLNLGMLLTESEKAKALRSVILDIVIDGLNKKTGGSTKLINQREDEFLIAIAREPLYRKEFTSALNLYLEMGNYKYAAYTDAIYKAIFKENAAEYKNILQLEESQNVRETMYSDVLKLIASFEIGIADELKQESGKLNRKLQPKELDNLIDSFTEKRFWIPQIEDVRSKMASRDYGFRDVVHERLKSYIGQLTEDDFQRFLGDKSKDLEERIKENIDVFKRLKDR
ncbi:MAG: DNA-binding protein [Bacteroidia bacterium]|nr:DNA-binding protein [Bacteroidia bacterium]